MAAVTLAGPGTPYDLSQLFPTLATLPLAAALGAALFGWAGRRLGHDPSRVERILLES